MTNLLDEPGIKVSMARNGNFSFSAENISIRKVLSEIAFFAGINLVIAPDVSGEVHVILNDVTWQSCLDTVLEIGNLEVIDKNGVLWVVPQINHFDGLTVNVVDELLLPKGIELLKYKDGLLSLNVQGVAISTLINELVNHLEDDSVLPTIVVQGDISNERIYGVIVNAPIISGLENLLFAHRLLLTRHDGQYFIERFPEQIPYLIQYSDGLLQIESTNAVLRNVLQEVALKTGVNFIIPEDLEHIISIELRNVVPQLAVEILLRGTGYKLEAYPDNQRGIEDWSGTFVFEPTIGSALADTDPIFAVSKQYDASVLSPGITVLEIDDAGIVAKFQDVLLHDLLSDIFLYGGPHFTTDLGLKNEKVSGEIRGEQVATSIRNFMHLQGYILIDLPEKTMVRSKNAGQPLVYFSEGLFYLDINNGDFNTIVREMANLCGEPIVIASQTKQTISSVQLYGVTFEQSLWYLLQGSSISFLKDDGVYIFGEGVQPQANLPNFTESEIFYLKHISPNQLLSVLPPTIPNANVKQITGRTAVVAFGVTEMLERIAEFIELVDMPTPVTPELVPIIYANSEELVNVLARHYSQDMFQYIPTQQSVLLNSTTDKNQEIKNLIAVLDTSDARMVTEVISLDHIKAEDAREYMDPRLSDSSIVVLASQNALVVSGSKDYLNQVREYLASIDTRNPQVVFEVMIVEISNRVSGQLGISVATADNSKKYDLLSGSPFSMILNSGFLAEPALTATLNALVQEGNAKLLANPRLTVLNGNEASFNVLTTSRYWVPQTGGNMSDQEGENQNKNSTQAFRTIETGIRLRLKPWVSASGEITIELYPEISDSAGSSMGSSLPSTNDRSVSTTVRVKDGETIMIGGLLQRSEYKEVNQVPLLGQTPIIGRLFSSETTSEIETEFIITITSHLIDFWQ